MRVKSALAVISVVVAFGLASHSPAEAGWCRRGAPPGWCGPQTVRHYVYYPNYRNVYYMATFAPDPYPYVYVPRGYWPRYERPYWRYGRRYWCAAPRALLRRASANSRAGRRRLLPRVPQVAPTAAPSRRNYIRVQATFMWRGFALQRERGRSSRVLSLDA